MSRFLRGTVILLITGFITRILGFINRIVIARIIGEEGVGLFMMAFPSLILIITITQLGMPIAISKTVAEAEARGDTKKTKKILVVSLAVTLGLSLIFTPLLILLAPYLSTHVFTDPRTYWPLMAIAPIVPVIAVSGVLRGYFQGKQNMKPFAYSQMIEQFVRIAFIATLTKMFLPYGIEYAAAGAMIASVIGELVSLVYLLMMFKYKKTFRFRKNFIAHLSTGKNTLLELFSVALPTTGSRMIGSISWFLEPIVVVRSLATAGIAATAATGLYGELTGYALPLLNLPSFITFSLGTALIPAVSAANSQGDYKLVEYRLQQALRFSFLSGSLAVILLYVLADPMLTVMYHSNHATKFIRFLAPFFIFFFYQGPLQAALQALNMAKAAMINSLIGSIVKISIIFILASQPQFGIMGVAIAMAVNIMLVTLLHFGSIMKKVTMTIYLRQYVLATLIMALSGLVGHLANSNWFVHLSLITNLCLTSFIMITLFCSLVLMVGLVHKDEVERIPWIGRYLSQFILFK